MTKKELLHSLYTTREVVSREGEFVDSTVLWEQDAQAVNGWSSSGCSPTAARPCSTRPTCIVLHQRLWQEMVGAVGIRGCEGRQRCSPEGLGWIIQILLKRAEQGRVHMEEGHRESGEEALADRNLSIHPDCLSSRSSCWAALCDKATERRNWALGQNDHLLPILYISCVIVMSWAGGY